MKRGDSYSVRYKYKDHSGKPCEGWESFKTKKEAQERKITVEKELLDGSFLVPDTMTVEELLHKLCAPCAERPFIREMCKWCAATFLYKEKTPNLTI